LQQVLRSKESITGRLLAHPLRHPLIERQEPLPALTEDATLEVVGASLHNLKNLHVRIPLEKLICVTGVSGSGKSTLVRDVIHDNVQHLVAERRRRRSRRNAPAFHGCEEINDWEGIGRVLEVDQTPIG
ncbi:MAG: hypothetical protein GWO16_13765, partial [Gammaproteobacteria bacterium]|nr:hypothetical protein [Gammaproteobacteria bacterium]NIR28476.1 hypothetical protein [Gammaproteobacteria bacterium]NIR82145.1 hypothetical protein [Gammaproteobacteria bacterium]NIT62620.1 hypothetical protein [Gammaproteobacteria bacterium]NIV75566.1 hypothetical protein [Gammaproteobacteria bacterium]